MLHKRPTFNDSKSKETISNKRQQFDKRDNKEEQGLDKNKKVIVDDRYLPLSPLALLPLPQKNSNRLSDLGKGTKSLTQLV